MANPIFVFPGQGSQTVGMCKDIFLEFQEMKQTVEEASDALGINMEDLLFTDPQNQLNLTEYTQPSLLTISTGIMRIIKNRSSLKATVVAGHSLGEYSALVALGTLEFSQAVKAVRFRGQAMQRAVPVGLGGMAAYLGTQAQSVTSLCSSISKDENVVEVVNFNSPGQLVLSGHKAAVDEACKQISAQKLGKAIPLPVSAPFHSSLMKPAALEMETFLSQNVSLKSYNGSIIANVDAKEYFHPSYTLQHLVKQIYSPVLWTMSLETLMQKGTLFIEVGAGSVLQGLIKKTVPTAVTYGTSDLNSLNSVLALN